MPLKCAMRSPPPIARTSRPNTVRFNMKAAMPIRTKAISTEFGIPAVRPE